MLEHSEWGQAKSWSESEIGMRCDRIGMLAVAVILFGCAAGRIKELSPQELAAQPSFGPGKIFKMGIDPIPDGAIPKPQGPPVTEQEKSAAKEAEVFCRKGTGYRAWVIRWAMPSDSTIRFQCLQFPPPAP